MRLQRLNMDTSWWLALGGRRLLVDPWLEGVEVDFAGWFNTQWHRTPPLAYDEVPPFDGVLITQKYPDHFHAQTLARLQPRILIAPRSLSRPLSRLLPDATLHLLCRDAPELSWGGLRIQCLASPRRMDPIYDAFVVDDGVSSAVIAPHGLNLGPEHLARLAATPPCSVLISPFNRYRLPRWLGGVITPGLAGLAALVDQLDPARVVQTHDEPKHARGLVPRLAEIQAVDPSALPDWLALRHLPIPDYAPVAL